MFKLHDGAQVSTIYFKLSGTNPQKRLGWSCFGKSSIPNAFLGLSVIWGMTCFINFFKKVLGAMEQMILILFSFGCV